MAEPHGGFPKLLESHIVRQTTWENLPQQAKQLVNNSRDSWDEAVVQYSLRHQLRWRTSLVKSIRTDERAYYEELIRTSRTQLMLYPYHLSDVLIKGLRITPFRYYYDMMSEVMQAERSYDVLPNFTAIDGVRLLGIGRNQYIDIMNRCRQRSWSQIFNKKKSTIKQLLPTEPIDIEMEYWWTMNIGSVSEDDLRGIDTDERAAIEVLVNNGPRPVGEFRKVLVQSLYRKGLVYLDVPIDDDDQISVPPLEGFVMNRVLGDYFENLLYQIFVSIDERTSIQQLAGLLQIDINMVKLAVSLYIRLGFAKKKNVEPLSALGKDSKATWHKSWYRHVTFEDTASASNKDGTATSSESSSEFGNGAATAVAPSERALSFQREVLDTFQSAEMQCGNKRVGLVLDSTITAFLMMGNLAAGLKSHAVTLFEVGKLADEVLDNFLTELDTVSDTSEGEAQRYFDHAITLRETIRFFRYNTKCFVNGSDGGLDLLRCERLESLDQGTRSRILQKNYALLISMAPISTETPNITSCIPRHFGASIAEINSGWFKLFAYHLSGTGLPSILFPRGTRLRSLPDMFQDGEYFLVTQWGHDATQTTANNVLAVVNDALLAMPVLLQLLSYTSNEPRTIDVPFPPPPLQQQQLLSLDGGDAAAAAAAAPEAGSIGLSAEQLRLAHGPVVRELLGKLGIDHQFGFIRFVQLHADQWVLQEVVFGLPLFEHAMCNQVCRSIAERSMFSNENLDRHSREQRTLSLRVLDFIAEHQGKPIELDHRRLPAPGVALCFNGRVLVS